MRKALAVAGSVGVLVMVPVSVGAVGGTGGNIGTAHGIAGAIPNGLVSSMYGEDMVGYTCASVHEKRATGLVAHTGMKGPGVQDKQSCKLDPGAELPKRPITYTPGDCMHPSAFLNAPDAYFGWYSDYKYNANDGELVLADTVMYTIMPSGTLVITSFYADDSECPDSP